MKARVGNYSSRRSTTSPSPDGRFLRGSACLGGKGLRVIDVRSGISEVAADRDDGDSTRSRGASRPTGGSSRSPMTDISAATTATSAWSRRRSRRSRRAATLRGRGRPESDEERTRSAINGSPAVDVYKTSDLSFAFAADTAGIDHRQPVGENVAWSSDGQLVAGGYYGKQGSDGVWRRFLSSVWEGGGRRSTARAA